LIVAVAERIRAIDRRPALVGIAGAVAVGKSTLARRLADELSPLRIEVVATDGFLLPNAELDRLGLSMQKGFPASYDADAMTSFVGDLRAGRPAAVPVYSHAIYDRVPDEVRVIDGADVDVVIVEGVNALQPELATGLDLAIYLHADEPLVRSWYVERFVEEIVGAEADPASFYRRFVDLDEAGRRSMAVAVWQTVNLVNLVENIAPTRANADLVLTKTEGHALA
jgi:type I pantothenate kinase